MPLYDVHQRRIVRIKHERIEADSALDAISKVENDPALVSEAYKRIQRCSAATGTITDIETDDGEAPSSYLVDLVGDKDYLHTVDYTLQDDGSYALHVAQLTVSDLQQQMLASLALNMPSAVADTHPIKQAIMAAGDGLARSDRAHAIRRLDRSIAALAAVRIRLAIQEDPA